MGVGLRRRNEPLNVCGMTCNYTVILEKEPGGGYHAFCPALKGCHTDGETADEAMRSIREAIELYLESLIAHDEPVPAEAIQIASILVTV